MSWLSDIAGKAETFLNKLDQNAAVFVEAATDSDIFENSRKKSEKLSEHYANPLEIVIGDSQNVLSNQEVVLVKKSEPPKSSFQQELKRKSQKDLDDQLIKFLNEPSQTSEHQKQPSCDLQMHQIEQLNESAPRDMDSNELPFVKDKNVGSESGLQSDENLLREFESLTQELNQVENRAKSAEKECDSLREMLASKRQELRQRERRNLEISEIAEKSKMTVKHLEETITALQDQMKEEKARSLDLSCQLEAKENDFQSLKSKSADQFKAEEEKLLNVIRNLENELSSQRSENNALAGSLQLKDGHIQDLGSKLESANEELSNLSKEFEEYKVKARKVLSEKDKLLSSCSETRQTTGSLTDQVDLQHVMAEKNLLLEEMMQLNSKLTTAKLEFSEMERDLNQKIEDSLRRQRELEAKLLEAQNKQTKTDAELKHRQTEISYLQEELTRSRLESTSKLKEKENEIKGFKVQIELNQKAARSSPLPDEKSPSSFEARIAFLTETLLLKQSLLEAVTADKTALVMKVEKLEKDISELQANLVEAQTFESDSNFEFNSVIKRRKYSTLDKFSARIGVTLRRYPTARIFILVYMICLHLWVFFVLFHSTSDLTLPPAK